MALKRTARARVLIMSVFLATTTLVWSGGEKDMSASTRTIGADRIVSRQAFPPENGPLCEFPAGQLSLAAASPQQASSGAVAASTDVANRKPLRYIADPDFAFAGVAVDPIRDEVVFADENVSALVVYDRLTNTPPTVARSEPKRVIEGEKTFLEFVVAVYIDPDTGDFYGINNDTENWMPVFGREAEGNVSPRVALRTPHTTAGMVVDEAQQELFLTIQDDHAVVVFDKYARDPYPAWEGRGPPPGPLPSPGPKRILQGGRTMLADPHGIALDTKRGEIFVVNWGINNERPPLSARGEGLDNRRPDFPVGRRNAFRSSGKIQAPSITVYPKDAQGDTPPLRVIQGPKTQLNWATSLAVDPERGELFVANDVGDAVTVFRTDASGDVAPIRVLKGPRSMIKNPNGVAVDLKNQELWVANFGNHSATVFPIDATGDPAPLRVIRSAPIGTPTPKLSNPHTVAFDSKRNEILAANCVGHPGIMAYAKTADGSAAPTREIVGQNTLISRTVHDMEYDPVHDEIIVPAFYAFGILTFRGDANGDVAPVRKIFGPSTQLRNTEAVAVDPVHDEIFVPQGDRVLVFPREADGDVAPIRILGGPEAGLSLGRVTVDPINNVLIASGGRGGFRIFDRTASGNTKPLRVIASSGSSLMRTYPPKGLFFAATGRGNRHDLVDYIGVWSIYDDGDVPARWTIGKGLFKDIRGIAIDPEAKTVIASDKSLNAIVTFYVPEIFDDPQSTESR